MLEIWENLHHSKISRYTVQADNTPVEKRNKSSTYTLYKVEMKTQKKINPIQEEGEEVRQEKYQLY